MFFFVFFGDGVFVSEDEVDFICCAAFVGSKHDCVGCFVGEFLCLDTFWGLGEEFHVCTSTFKTVLEFHFISYPCQRNSRRRGMGRYCRTRVFPVLSTGASKDAEMAWWAATFFTTSPLSPIIPLKTVGSSTDHCPT